MRALFRAIFAALAAVRYVWERSVETGHLVLRAVAGIGAVPTLPIEPPTEIERRRDMLLKPPRPAPPANNRIYRLQRCCRAINSRQQPSAQDWRALSELERDWIETMSAGSRLIVGNIAEAALLDHMNGRKVLKSVLEFDRAAIDAYSAAERRAQRVVESAIEVGEDPDLALEAVLGW